MTSVSTERRIRLIIVGDEILSGRRQDKHFGKIVDMLSARGLSVHQAQLLPDDRATMTDAF